VRDSPQSFKECEDVWAVSIPCRHLIFINIAHFSFSVISEYFSLILCS
jgi:hypothetical protein